MSNKKDGVIYIGVTSDLIKRVNEHKDELHNGFSKKYNTKKLVYYEVYNDISEAIKREKQLKKWNRSWKIDLIENFNKEWQDLYYAILG